MEYPIISEIICTTSTEYASHWLQLEVLALPLQSRSRRELSHRLTGDIGRVKPTIIGGYLWKLGKLTNSVPDNVRSSIWRFWAYPQAKFIITSGLGILTKKKIEVMQKVGILMHQDYHKSRIIYFCHCESHNETQRGPVRLWWMTRRGIMTVEYHWLLTHWKFGIHCPQCATHFWLDH